MRLSRAMGPLSTQLPTIVPSGYPIHGQNRRAELDAKHLLGLIGEQRSSLVQLDGEIGSPWMERQRGLPRSGCAPLIAVVKPADLRNGDDSSGLWRLHGSCFRRILGQREV